MTGPAAATSNTVSSRIKRHPITSFFVLAFALSWLAWVPYVLSQNGLGLTGIRFPTVLGTSQLLGVLPGAYLGPIFAAFVVTALAEGRVGLRRWLRRLLRWRVGWRWYLVALVLVPAGLILAGIPFAGGWSHVHAPSAMVLLLYVPMLALQVITTGVAEEPGWRDFALPQLQPRFGALRGTLLLGPLWGAWHLPLFLTEWGGYPDVTWVQPVEFIGAAVAISVVMTWVFNRSGESLPIAMLLHTSVNTYFTLGAAAMFPMIGARNASLHVTLLAFGVVALVLIVATRGRLGYRPTVAPRASRITAGEGRR